MGERRWKSIKFESCWAPLRSVFIRRKGWPFTGNQETKRERAKSLKSTLDVQPVEITNTFIVIILGHKRDS